MQSDIIRDPDKFRSDTQCSSFQADFDDNITDRDLECRSDPAKHGRTALYL